jgi:hypothetical protein
MLFAAVHSDAIGTSRQFEATHGVGRYWGIADITGFLFLAVDELTLSYRHEANADIPKPA